jgi:FkbM family methyltransferase
VLATITRLLRAGDCFVDAGANIGVYSILGSTLVGADGQVISVEMIPDTAQILRNHITENGCTNITVIQAALSDHEGQEVTASLEPGKFGSASIAVKRGAHELLVPTTTLASVIGSISRVRLIKMDLEGAELAALVGTHSVLDRVDAILFEDWGDNSVASWLESNGFQIARLDANNSLATSQSIRDFEAHSRSH